MFKNIILGISYWHNNHSKTQIILSLCIDMSRNCHIRGGHCVSNNTNMLQKVLAAYQVSILQ
jgi:hypothetical protein